MDKTPACNVNWVPRLLGLIVDVSILDGDQIIVPSTKVRLQTRRVSRTLQDIPIAVMKKVTYVVMLAGNKSHGRRNTQLDQTRAEVARVR